MFRVLKRNRRDTWQEIRARYNKGKMDAKAFVNEMKDIKLHYSTPFGDGIDGNRHLYFVTNKRTGYMYYPAFFTLEHCMQFFKTAGRAGFMVLEGDLKRLLSSLDGLPSSAELGVIIEPTFPDETIIPPGVRVE